MRAVYRLRVYAQAHLLPLVLGALVLRALIPVGFMPGSGGTLTAMLCAPSAPGNQRTEILEIPGATQAPHCDYCTAPLLGGAPDFFVPGAPAPAFDNLAFSFSDEAPPAFVAARAHRPRGPPLA